MRVVKNISTEDIRYENKSDKEKQLEYLMLRFGKKVYQLAYYYLRDRQQAEDIYQEVFLRVYENLDRFRQESNYYTWIYRITVNLCKDYFKSAVFRKIVTAGISNDLSKSWRESNKLFEEVEGGEVFSLVLDLPKKYRVPLCLHYIDDLSVSEIANILNISENNVKVRLYRGREKLKSLLSGRNINE
ncbi:MAG: sigma-70 family RNA polymerase sigma factor [Clostridiaceae bacterium]|nr:sigma-70 family RNA polymerase sigma factor [Clostridiaceae bacterium]